MRKDAHLFQLIEGAKWTVGASVIIAILRVIVGGGIGLLLGMYSKRSFPVIASFDPFSIVPMVMIFVLKEVLVFENGTVPEPFHLRLIFQMVILTCLAVPTIMLYTAQEVRRIKEKNL